MQARKKAIGTLGGGWQGVDNEGSAGGWGGRKSGTGRLSEVLQLV